MISSRLICAFWFLALSDIAVAEQQITKDFVLTDVSTRLTLGQCARLPLGRIDIKPYSQQALAKSIMALEKAGIIVMEDANQSSGNVWQDLSSHLGQEVGEGDLNISIAPNADRQQFENRFGTTCLKTGIVVDNIKVVSFDVFDVKGADFISKKVAVSQLTYDNDGDTNSLYQAYLDNLGTPLIRRAKLRIVYSYDPFKDHWDFDGLDIGDIKESFFKSNIVEQYLSRYSQTH